MSRVTRETQLKKFLARLRNTKAALISAIQLAQMTIMYDTALPHTLYPQIVS